MEQDWFLYSITLFTFSVIFLMCYIQHVFTYFQGKKQFLISQPTFPFGNVYDVGFLQIPLFLKLWKYSNKLRKKSQPFGGFFIFLKPAVLVVDPQLSRKILANSPDFENVLPGIEVSAELWDRIIEKYLSDFRQSWQAINQHFDNNQINLSSAMDDFIVECCIRKIFCIHPKYSQKVKDSMQKEQTFCDLLLLSYPNKFFSGFLKSRKNLIPDSAFIDGNNIFQNIGKNITSKAQLFTQVLITLRSVNNLILLTLYEIAQSPKIQKTLREEIQILGDEAKDGPYLEAVICETLRKYPPQPFIAKTCNKDYKFNDGVVFEKNMPIFVSTFGIHHDQQNFLNPERFQPSRFINSVNLSIDNTRYFPFNQSTSNDLEVIYKSIIKAVLKEIISNTKLSLSEKTPILLEFSDGIFQLKAKEDMWLKINKI